MSKEFGWYNEVRFGPLDDSNESEENSIISTDQIKKEKANNANEKPFDYTVPENPFLRKRFSALSSKNLKESAEINGSPETKIDANTDNFNSSRELSEIHGKILGSIPHTAIYTLGDQSFLSVMSLNENRKNGESKTGNKDEAQSSRKRVNPIKLPSVSLESDENKPGISSEESEGFQTKKIILTLDDSDFSSILAKMNSKRVKIELRPRSP